MTPPPRPSPPPPPPLRARPRSTPAPQLILPVGTQVVSRIVVKGGRGRPPAPAGAVGEVVRAPADATHAYRVRLADGREVGLKRGQLQVRRLAQRAGFARPAELDLFPYVIYRCVIGSRAYGLDQAGSDTDRRGIYLPPADCQWSLFGVPEQLERAATQECYWELQKFLRLALQANPNVLECLYTPLVELATPLARRLLALRGCFLSRLAYQTYGGYVLSQFKKLEQDLRARGAIKWKHVMHLIRLLLSGITLLEEGAVPVDVGPYRERLLAIRRGEVPWAEVEAWRQELHRRFDAAYRDTRLPERPDFERVDDFLVVARRSML
ncbi:MAG: nucleotidyltransferase domain-containing protein [Planctomycetes bacterium]|nr:nucleotidyltransferase domain-containing protein [Planctomycetota bacterium]